VTFELGDAAKPANKYCLEATGEDISHIYSYNKVMSKPDCEGICQILNRTNFKVLAWYYGPKDTESFGLKNFLLLFKMPMQSTGKEKFQCYVYLKTSKSSGGKSSSKPKSKSK